jgi:hypothetical protein
MPSNETINFRQAIMKIWIVLFLFFTQTRTYAATILSQGARNVKNGAAYGGASAVGDGVTDDTQAFLDAFNINRNLGKGNWPTGVAIYVPPGNYVVSKQLIVWSSTTLFGEPSARPTIILRANSIVTGSPAPFMVVRNGYNHPPYDTNWIAGGQFASNNNTFTTYVHDINFTVQPSNTSCSSVFEWDIAQCTALRNSVLTGTASQVAALDTQPSSADPEAGGGGVIQNVTMSGCQNATIQNSVFERVFRGCTFNGPVLLQGGIYVMNFIACTFNNAGGSGFNNQTSIGTLGMDDCTFTANTPFNPSSGGGSVGTYHLENTTFGSSNASPPFPAGVLVQYTSGNVYYNGISEPGASLNLNSPGVAKGSPYANPPYPSPSAACVSILSYGGNGDGSFDNTTAIRNALSAANEVYFPPGNYSVGTNTITLGPGQKIWGAGPMLSRITGSANPVMATTGRGSAGVTIAAILIAQTGANGYVMTWNADQSSVMMDAELGNINTTSYGLINFQSGGGVWEDACPALFAGITVNRLADVSSTDPLYLYAVDPQHYTSVTYNFVNAQNVYIRECTFETLDNFTGAELMNIAGCSNLNFCNVCFAVRGAGTPNLGALISNSAVSIFGSSMNRYNIGLIQNGGLTHGTGGTGGEFQTLNECTNASP